MIGIRVDANNIIATGHMMRCITIAKEIVALGQNVIFFIADEESDILLRSHISSGMETVILGTDYSDMENETDILAKKAEKHSIDVLLVDSYCVTKKYFETLSKLFKVAYIDDLRKDAYSVDILINYSGYSINMGYETIYGDKNTKLMLGLKYAPLRRQFYQADDMNQTLDFVVDPLQILLSTGGADPCNMLLPILHSVYETGLCENLTWNVIVGDYVSGKEELWAFAEGKSNIILKESVENMASLMRKCSLAVVAAGTMLTECAACGLPAVFYQVADNQSYNVEYFGGLEGMIFVGDVTKNQSAKDMTISAICDQVKSLMSDNARRKLMSDSLSEITDGRGAVRIAKALVEI